MAGLRGCFHALQLSLRKKKRLLNILRRPHPRVHSAGPLALPGAQIPKA